MYQQYRNEKGETVTEKVPDEEIIEDIDLEGFRKVQVVNDWGFCGFYLRAKKTHGAWSINTQDPTQALPTGRPISVKWPDGSITIETLAVEHAVSRVSDHGNSYGVSYYEPYIEKQIHGESARIDIRKLRFKFLPE